MSEVEDLLEVEATTGEITGATTGATTGAIAGVIAGATTETPSGAIAGAIISDEDLFLLASLSCKPLPAAALVTVARAGDEGFAFSGCLSVRLPLEADPGA